MTPEIGSVITDDNNKTWVVFAVNDTLIYLLHKDGYVSEYDWKWRDKIKVRVLVL